MIKEASLVDSLRLFTALTQRYDRITSSYERAPYYEQVGRALSPYMHAGELVVTAVDMDSLHALNTETGGYTVGDEALR